MKVSVVKEWILFILSSFIFQRSAELNAMNLCKALSKEWLWDAEGLELKKIKRLKSRTASLQFAGGSAPSRFHFPAVYGDAAGVSECLCAPSPAPHFSSHEWK